MKWPKFPTDRRSPSPADHKPERAPQGGPPATWPPRRMWLVFLLVLGVNFVVTRFFAPGAETPLIVPYTVFKEQVLANNVESIYSRGEVIEGRFTKAVAYPTQERSASNTDARGVAHGEPRTANAFKTTLPAFVDPGLETLLIEHKVEISAVPIQSGGSPWTTLLFGFGPALLIIGFYVWMFRRAQRGGGLGGSLMGIGASKARRYDSERDTKITFEDVAGIDEAENELI
jgi:cell division protease FtsH